MLKKLSNKKTLNVMILVSCAIFAFSLYKIKTIKGVSQSIEYASDDLSLSQSELARANRELQDVQEKYSKFPISKTSPLKDNGHLLLDDIKRDGKRYSMNVSFFLESDQGQGAVNFGDESGIDENTGVSFYTMRIISNYESYSQLKSFINYITGKYPVSVNSISMSGKEMQLVINIYGN